MLATVDLRNGYRRIALIVAVVAGIVGTGVGVGLSAEEAHTMPVWAIILTLVAWPSFAFAAAFCLLWFGGLTIAQLSVWVIRGFTGESHVEPSGRRGVFQDVKPRRVALLLALSLPTFVVGAICLWMLTDPPGKRPVRKPPKPSPTPSVTLCELPTDQIEGYDWTLDSGGTLFGFIKNDSKARLEQVEVRIIVRNSREDILFRGSRTIRCKIPPGEARHFSHRGAVPSISLPNPSDQRSQWEWKWGWRLVAALGQGEVAEDLDIESIPDKVREAARAELERRASQRRASADANDK